MNEFFTIMLKENDTNGLKLLTEKLNDGFRVDETITVGRSSVVSLRRLVRTNELIPRNSSLAEASLGLENLISEIGSN